MAPPTTPDKLPSSDMFGETAIVKVGENLQKSFTLHKGVLSFYSGYFNAALNGEFAEAKDGIIELPTEEPASFARFALWLYTGHVERNSDWCYDTITKLWLLGDRREIPLLQNNMIDELRDHHVSVWLAPTSVINMAYQESVAHSPLRRFLIYLISTYSSANLALAPDLMDFGGWDKESLWDLATAVWTVWASGVKDGTETKESLAKMDLCPYHVHEDGVTCLKGSDY